MPDLNVERFKSDFYKLAKEHGFSEEQISMDLRIPQKPEPVVGMGSEIPCKVIKRRPRIVTGKPCSFASL